MLLPGLLSCSSCTAAAEPISTSHHSRQATCPPESQCCQCRVASRTAAINAQPVGVHQPLTRQVCSCCTHVSNINHTPTATQPVPIGTAKAGAATCAAAVTAGISSKHGTAASDRHTVLQLGKGLAIWRWARLQPPPCATSLTPHSLLSDCVYLPRCELTSE